MPNISYTKEGGTITWDSEDWLSGQADQLLSFGDPAKLLTGAFIAQSNFDPYRNPGYAQPGFLGSNVTNASTQASGSFFKAYANKDNDEDYLLTGNGKVCLLDFDEATPALTSDATWPHTIAHGAHSTFVGEDVVMYKHNSGGSVVTSLFYSFRDATDWDVGAYINQASFDDDFMSTVPASPLAGTDLTGGASVPHFMFTGKDDILYMLSGRFVHGYDGFTGANGTFISQALILPQGFIGTCAAKYQNFAVIGGFNAGAVGYSAVTSSTFPSYGEGYVYFWDYLNPDVYDEIPVQDKYVADIFIGDDGGLYIVTFGNKGGTANAKLKRWNGSVFELVPKGEFADSIAIPRSGRINNGRQLMFNCNGNVKTYGSPYVNYPIGVNSIYSAGETTTSGVLIDHRPTYGIFASGGAGLQKLSTGYALASASTTTVEPQFPMRKRGRIKKVVIFFRTTASGGRNLLVEFIADSSSFGLYNDQAVVDPLVYSFEHDNANGQLSFFKQLGLRLSWTAPGGSTTTDAPVVSRVVVEFEFEELDNIDNF